MWERGSFNPGRKIDHMNPDYEKNSQLLEAYEKSLFFNESIPVMRTPVKYIEKKQANNINFAQRNDASLPNESEYFSFNEIHKQNSFENSNKHDLQEQDNEANIHASMGFNNHDPLTPETINDYQNLNDSIPINSQYTLNDQSLVSGSPKRLSKRNVSYNYDDLPPEAFQNPEDEISPIVFNFDLTPRMARIDNEQDSGFVQVPFDTQTFVDYIGSDIVCNLNSKDWRNRIEVLNEIQLMFKNEPDLDDQADILLTITVFFQKETSLSVNLCLIDFIRQIIAKSESISKQILSRLFPFLIEKLSDKHKALIRAIYELIRLIAKAVCPSFVLQQLVELTIDSHNTRTAIVSMPLSFEIIKQFGCDGISIQDYMPKLVKFLSNSNFDVRSAASGICAYLYKFDSNQLEPYLVDLNETMQTRIRSHPNFPSPTDIFYRRRENPNKISDKRLKLTLFVPPESIEHAKESNSWKDRSDFIDEIESALSKCNKRISSTDLEGILRILCEGNYPTILLRTLQLLEQIALASDKHIHRHTHCVTPLILQGWSANRPAVREAATKAALAFDDPTTIILAFLAMKTPTPTTKLEFMYYLQQANLREFDCTKIQIFFVDCLQDKNEEVRRAAADLAKFFYTSNPEFYADTMKILPSDIQKKLRNGLDESNISDQGLNESKLSSHMAPLKIEKESPKTPPRSHSGLTPPGSPVNLCFASSPSQAKKSKRMEKLIILEDDSNRIQYLYDKCRNDALSILPPYVTQKMFSALIADHSSAILDIKEMFSKESETVLLFSDIIVTYTAYHIYSRTPKICTQLFELLTEIFSLYKISKEEISLLIPAVTFGLNSGDTYLTDSILDLLFVFRRNVDNYFDIIYQNILKATGNALVIYFNELSSNASKLYNSEDVFKFACSKLSDKDEKIVKAASAFLALLCPNIPETDKNGYIHRLPGNERKLLGKFVAIDVGLIDFSMTGFSKLPREEMVELLKQASIAVRFRKSRIDISLNEILEVFLSDKVDWLVINQFLFTIYDFVGFGHLEPIQLERLFSMTCFFANRRQNQIKLVNGTMHIINSILNSLFNLLTPITLFNSVFEGMQSFCVDLNVDSFYCKVWRALILRIDQISGENDQMALLDFGYKKLDEEKEGTLIYKLLLALIVILSRKLPQPELEETVINETQLEINTPTKVSDQKVISPLVSTARHLSPPKQTDEDTSIISFIQKENYANQNQSTEIQPDERAPLFWSQNQNISQDADYQVNRAHYDDQIIRSNKHISHIPVPGKVKRRSKSIQPKIINGIPTSTPPRFSPTFERSQKSSSDDENPSRAVMQTSPFQGFESPKVDHISSTIQTDSPSMKALRTEIGRIIDEPTQTANSNYVDSSTQYNILQSPKIQNDEHFDNMHQNSSPDDSVSPTKSQANESLCRSLVNHNDLPLINIANPSFTYNSPQKTLNVPQSFSQNRNPQKSPVSQSFPSRNSTPDERPFIIQSYQPSPGSVRQSSFQSQGASPRAVRDDQRPVMYLSNSSGVPEPKTETNCDTPRRSQRKSMPTSSHSPLIETPMKRASPASSQNMTPVSAKRQSSPNRVSHIPPPTQIQRSPKKSISPQNQKVQNLKAPNDVKLVIGNEVVYNPPPTTPQTQKKGQQARLNPSPLAQAFQMSSDQSTSGSQRTQLSVSTPTVATAASITQSVSPFTPKQDLPSEMNNSIKAVTINPSTKRSQYEPNSTIVSQKIDAILNATESTPPPKQRVSFAGMPTPARPIEPVTPNTSRVGMDDMVDKLQSFWDGLQ